MAAPDFPSWPRDALNDYAEACYEDLAAHRKAQAFNEHRLIEEVQRSHAWRTAALMFAVAAGAGWATVAAAAVWH